MYSEYERVCADLEETLSITQTSFTSRFGALTDSDTSIRQRILETLELISTSDLSDSLLLRLRGGTDLSPAFQTIEINILVFCGVPLKDAFEIVKRTPPLQEVISDSGAFFLTPSMSESKRGPTSTRCEHKTQLPMGNIKNSPSVF